jgi:N-acetylglucosamine-6-phosphate deacetylase
MTAIALLGGDVLTPLESVPNGTVVIEDGHLQYVGPSPGGPDVAATVIDVTGCYVCPGFVDLQVNGGGGALLTEDPTLDAIRQMTRTHARFGSTAMLPTVVTGSEATMCRALEAVARAAASAPEGARVLGSHIEGPFINPVRKGAHDERFIRAPNVSLFRRFVEAAQGTLRLITLAPELSGAMELIAAAREAGVVVSLGHTDASYEEAEAAIDAGASFATHAFNAMRPLRQRDPGVLGAVLERNEVVAGTIADGAHVHHSVLALLARSKGPRGLALVTDAMPPSGLSLATFELQQRTVYLRNGACYLENGTLAGSALTMDAAIRTMHEQAGIPPLDAIMMSTSTPAGVLGMQDTFGILRSGAPADVVVLDRRLHVSHVFVGGKQIPSED